MKNYPPQLKVDAVALYESRATIRSVAADLGINLETLRNWVRAADASRPRGRRAEASVESPTALEAENAALRKKVRELEEEREILRKSALSARQGGGAPRSGGGCTPGTTEPHRGCLRTASAGRPAGMAGCTGQPPHGEDSGARRGLCVLQHALRGRVRPVQRGVVQNGPDLDEWVRSLQWS
ncbi:transposase [Streptomyces sp. NPDC007002]|uniref:transposase n=1 Tax=Streptomyces sp. NPDC007002 TaxID=3156910 RepID=UPI003452F6B3